MLNRKPRGSAFCWVLAFSTTSCHQWVSKTIRVPRAPSSGCCFPYHILSAFSLDPNSSGAPRTPSAWRGFPYHISSLTPTPDFLSWLSYILVQRPLKRLLNLWNGMFDLTGASVYECIMGFFTLSHFISQIPPTRFLSITCHWDVSLPSSASLWNGIFARVEGQNTTDDFFIYMSFHWYYMLALPELRVDYNLGPITDLTWYSVN